MIAKRPIISFTADVILKFITVIVLALYVPVMAYALDRIFIHDRDIETLKAGAAYREKAIEALRLQLETMRLENNINNEKILNKIDRMLLKRTSNGQ